MNRSEICRRIERVGIAPVIRARTPDIALRTIDAIIAGGISVIEVTMTVPKAVALVREVCKRYGESLLVGAGTVLDRASVAACIDAGAEFIVSPKLDFEIIRASHHMGKPAIPGALTPTEIISAFDAGVEIVKVFPCSAVGGPSYIRAILGPMPWAKLLPTGGVGLATAADYIRAGAAALGVGTDLADTRAIEGGDAKIVTRRSAELLAIVNEARAGMSETTGPGKTS
jgi:2-dehydro-3-deoxyphosphogluconate aldolase/(4S)-4-hydroxy-2-oxoglutarate aldolase